MEIRLTFFITFVNGETTEQEITVPADPAHSVEKQMLIVMNQMLRQYATVGILRHPKDGKFLLICPSQIATVECDLPSIILANSMDTPNVDVEGKPKSNGIIHG